ncbi:MAG: hypothetical protein FJ039_09240 [Chloroflexi bacterium]|nr:hypothetical protein [Chloroflexota bacterium]
MIRVPGFLLKRLYVKGSLKNNGDGFEFKLKNSLGSGYAYGLPPLKIDGEELPAERCYFTVEGKALGFPAVSKENPASLAMNREATITAHGKSLAAGPHKVTMSFVVAGLGQLSFDFTDAIA